MLCATDPHQQGPGCRGIQDARRKAIAGAHRTGDEPGIHTPVPAPHSDVRAGAHVRTHGLPETERGADGVPGG